MPFNGRLSERLTGFLSFQPGRAEGIILCSIVISFRNMHYSHDRWSIHCTIK